ncbi:MAG: hypothetical protein QXP53_00445 [Candidatus Pacearchaeota archaeon]
MKISKPLVIFLFVLGTTASEPRQSNMMQKFMFLSKAECEIQGYVS